MVLCCNEHITQLNAEWRGKAEPTDVLSFGMEMDGSEGYPVRVLGDLVISLDTADRQAQERGYKPTPKAMFMRLCWVTPADPIDAPLQHAARTPVTVLSDGGVSGSFVLG